MKSQKQGEGLDQAEVNIERCPRQTVESSTYMISDLSAKWEEQQLNKHHVLLWGEEASLCNFYISDKEEVA